MESWSIRPCPAPVPVTGTTNESIVTVTELNYTQLLSEKFGVMLGKFQSLDGDPNEFASGRGRNQFMNFNFIASNAGALTIPYSTVGGGVLWLPTDKIVVSSMLVSVDDSSTTTGFEKLNEGLSWISEADFQYRLGDLPGGCNIGASYAFSGSFAHLGGKLVLIPGQGLTLPQKSDSWCVFASAWQYLYTPDKAPEKIDPGNGRPDVRGVGLFARVGFADKDTNPVDWSLSGGVGGRGLIPSRDNDTYGAGYVYTKLSNSSRLAALLFESSTQGLEAFYNVAITPAVGLTFDVQWLASAFPNVNQATIVGARLDMRF